MERIASFTVDHTKLQPGMYLSRQDGAVVTYLSYCKISHKRGYFDMFIVAGAIPILANIVAIILGTIGIV